VTTLSLAGSPFRSLPCAAVLAATLFLSHALRAETEGSQEIADRYEQMLLRTPEQGTAFEKVVEWYNSTSGLPTLQKRWKENTDPASRRSLLILQGLLAQRLGNPDEARALFKEALALEGDKVQAARPLAALEATEGNFAEAADAYATALAAESLTPLQRLDLMRSLALLYQRAFDTDKALAVWREAVAKYPDDAFVQEEAGEAFLAAGSFDDARKSFTRQREIVTDPFQKISASLRIARTLEMAGKTADAQAIYESALEETAAGSWINREVRGQVDGLFRRKDDLPGLLAFYEKRMKAAPQDYATLVSQSQVLEELGRTEEAITSARNAANLAPDQPALRLTLVRLLAANERNEEALAEIADLAKSTSASAEILALTGNLNWTVHQQKHDDASRKAALAAWNRIAPENSKEIARIGQLAEILGSHGLSEEAQTQWQRMLALAPDLPEPRQRLAEIYLKKSDRDSAIKALAGFVEGPLAQPPNFVTLARIQERLEMPDLARETAAKGLALFPENYDLLSLAWRQAMDAKDSATVAKIYPVLWKQAPGEFASADAEKKYAEYLGSSDTGKDTAKALQEELQAGTIEPSRAALLFRVAIQQFDEATAKKALEKIRSGNDTIRAARAGLDFAVAFGAADDQIAAQQALATADPRLAGESLRAAARLLAENGKVAEGLEILNQLLEKSPADVSLYTLYADLASRSGKLEDAIQRLNRGIRQVDDSTTLRLQLATLMDAQGRSAEASKILQEAFEQEESESRRMEIFRRQVEVAQRTGQIDDLIASLREKQLREQNGARYGTYLAEIFLAQDDYLAARDELTRSLGRSPDNPAAISRLIDLAERGGDQDESLRLAKRLAEVAPSAANRATLLTKTLDAGETAEALELVNRERAEIIKDPKTWLGVLIALRNAGLDGESDVLIDEIVASAGPGIVAQADMAKLRLQQQKFNEAEKILWQVLESGDLGEATKAVAEDVPTQYAGFSNDWRFPFQMLASETQSFFYRALAGRSYFQPQGFSRSTGKSTPEQRELIGAFFTLLTLAEARQQEEAFSTRLRTLLADRKVPRVQRLMLLQLNGDRDGIAALLREQLQDPKADLEVDRQFVLIPPNPIWDEDLKAIRERLAKGDPAAEFEQAYQKATADLQSSKANGQASPTEYKKITETLLNHPGLTKSPGARTRVAMLAAMAGDFPLAFRLSDEEDAAKTPQQKAAMALQGIHVYSNRNAIILRAIVADDAMAAAELEKVIKDSAAQASSGSVYFSSYGMRVMRSNAPLAQANPDLVAGASAFPVPIFRAITGLGTGNVDGEKVRKWFVSRASTDKLDIFTLGAIYADWFAGKKEEAVKRAEAIHAKNPTPDSAALLFEIYEKGSQPAKAIAIAETAALQADETADVRSLRMIRLLRELGRKDEARALAERQARGRVSFAAREQLANELNLLGVSLDPYKHLTANNFFRSPQQRDRTEPVRLQVMKLVTDKKIDEAERIATQFLERPLPSRQDYRSINARQNMVGQLKSMGRLESYQQALRSRQEANPDDLILAIRLAESGMSDSSTKSAEQLRDFLQAHPQAHPAMEYALQLLMRSDRGEVAKTLSVLIRANPEILSASGLQPYELSNYISDGEAAPILAETFASLNDEEFSRVFMAGRLTQNSAEFATINQLAEAAIQAGKVDQAIVLLKRLRPLASKNLEMGLTTILRLAELQLEKGDEAAATETMKSLIELRMPSRLAYGYANVTLANVFFNLVFNPQNNGNGEALIRRTAGLAEKTGTYDSLIKSFDEQKAAFQGISPGLIMMTILGKDGAEKEWRELVLAENSQMSVSPALLPLAIKALSKEKDAAKLLPALVKRSSNMYGSHYALYTLTETLPLLSQYKSNPVIASFIASQVNQAMSDPNGSTYMLFSENYPASILSLLKEGFAEEARRLFDFTAATRSSGRYGRQPAMEEVERRMLSTEDKITMITAAITALPSATARKQVRWLIQPYLPPSEDNRSDRSISWTADSLNLPKELKPTAIEIFAGPNAAAMERVARKANPPLAGSIEATLPGSIGLVQVRWELPNGTTGAGPLSVYVTGENLITNNGVPAEKSGSNLSAFKQDIAGPGGEKSAVLYDTLSAASQFDLPITTVPLDPKSDTLIFVGWFGAPQGQRSAPFLDIQYIHQDGRVEKRGSSYSPVPPGEWVQAFGKWTSVRDGSGDAIPESAQKLKLGFQMNANRSFNGQYPISGLWDGIQLVRLKQQEVSTDIAPILSKFREAIGKKDYPNAANAFIEALRINPSSALQQQPAGIIESFKKSNRLADLFTQVGSPTLLLPNPMNRNNPTFSNPGLIGALTAEALAPDAPPAARAWLNMVKLAPLSEEIRFVVQAGILTASATQKPGSVKPEEILAVMGFDPKGLNDERLRMLWYFEIQNKPTPSILALLEDENLAKETQKQLAALEVPTNLQAARLMLDAWIIAPKDPVTALASWNQTIAMRYGGQSSVSVEESALRALLQRIALQHPEPGLIVAALRSWLAKARPNGQDHDRVLVEFLYKAAAQEGPNREKLAGLWADAELAALKTPNYNGSRDRVRELAFRLMKDAQWDRLDELITSSLASKNLSDDALRKEFTLLRNITDFSKGNLDLAWPVIWCTPGTGSQTVTAKWQWNIKDISWDRNDFDTAVSLAEKPLVPEIKGQKSIEIFFGEMPSEMALIATAEGAASQGDLSLKLPAANGFLRAVAVIDGKRHPGPLTPVLSGRRIFPPANTSLGDMLQSGSDPIPPSSIAASGEAPDGSPALRLGVPSQNRQLDYSGPEFPVAQGKFYASRAWLRRAGNGSATVSTKFTPVKGSTKGTLEMLVSEEMETTGQWVLYTRAIPTVNQHTFWIPMDEVASIMPRLWNIPAGTELAGFEVLEIDDWKYGKWIVELSMLRKNAGDPPDAATLDRAVELASIEPLTSMDYHGDWLARNLNAAGRSEDLMKLARAALNAEANPLFSRPKIPRIFDYLLGVLHREEGTPEFRYELAQLVLASPTRTSAQQRTAALAYAIALAPQDKREEAAKLAREEIAQKLGDPDKSRAYLKSLLTARTGRGDRPANELLNLLLVLNDAETSASFLKAIQGKGGENFELSDRVFATIALEAAQANATANPAWQDEISRGFRATENLDSPDAYMRWPFVLADFLAARQLAPEAVAKLRKDSLQRVLAAKPDHNGKTTESIRAAAFLIEYTLAQKGDAHETVETIVPIVQASTKTISEGSLRLLLNAAKLLNEAGATADATALAKAVEPALSRFPKMSADFSRYLTPSS
jgi:tetratricopeptide (TPR) repeat protein